MVLAETIQDKIGCASQMFLLNVLRQRQSEVT